MARLSGGHGSTRQKDDANGKTNGQPHSAAISPKRPSCMLFVQILRKTSGDPCPPANTKPQETEIQELRFALFCRGMLKQCPANLGLLQSFAQRIEC